MPVKSGYSYYKEVTITGSADSALDLYQMKVLVGESSGATGEDVDCGGHCLSTFNDLWFQGYDADGSTIIDLDYWIESITGTTPNQLATVWVEIHYIPIAAGTTTIWMSYGKAGASAASNGENTFRFFDHFDGDLSKWQGSTDHCAVASSKVTLTSNDASNHLISSLSAYTGDIRMRCSAKINNADYSTVGINADQTTHNNIVKSFHYSGRTNHSASECIRVGALTVISSTALGFDAYHTYDFIRILTGTDTARIFMDDVELGSGSTTNVPTADLYPQIWAYGTGVTTALDWIFVANLTANEPTWGAWGAEQSATKSVPHMARIMLMSP